MTVVDTQALTESADCKRFGCVEEAASRRGRYANLCDRHKREQMELDRKDGSLGGARTQARNRAVEAGVDPELKDALYAAAGVEPVEDDDVDVADHNVVGLTKHEHDEAHGRRARSNGSRSNGDVSLTDIAKRMPPVAARLEKSMKAKRDVSAQARDALAEFQSMLVELRDAAQELIGSSR